MASKRPVDVTVLAAKNLRKLRLVTAPPVAVVSIEGSNERFVTNPGVGEDPVWKARHVFYVDEELISGDEATNIRVDIFDSPALDGLLGTAVISLETAMDHYNKAHSYALFAEGKPCGIVTIAVSVAPRSRAPVTLPSPSSALPGPLYGPPLPGEPVPLQKQASGPMQTPVRGGSGRFMEPRPGLGPVPATVASPGSMPFRPQSHSPIPGPYVNQANPVPNHIAGPANGSYYSPSGPPSRPVYSPGPHPGPSSQPGPTSGPEFRVRQPAPVQAGQPMLSAQPIQPGPYPTQGPPPPYLPAQSPGYAPRGYGPPPYGMPVYPPYPSPGVAPPQRGYAGYPPGGPYQNQQGIERNRGEGFGGAGDVAGGLVEAAVIGAVGGYVVGEVLDDDDDDDSY